MFPGHVEHGFGDALIQFRLKHFQHGNIRSRNVPTADLFHVNLIQVGQVFDVQAMPEKHILERSIVPHAHSFSQTTEAGQGIGGLFRRSDEDALKTEQGLRHAPAFVGLADQRRCRHADVVEEGFGEFLVQIQRHQRPHGNARRVHGNEEKSNPLLLFRFSVRPRQHINPVGVHRHRRPDFLAVDDVVVAVTLRDRAQRCEIGTGIGFAIALAPDVFAGQNLREEGGALFVGPVRDQQWSDHQHALVDGPCAAMAFELVQHNQLLAGRQAHAAMLLRPAGAEPAFFGQLEIPGFALVPVQSLQRIADFRGIVRGHPFAHDQAEFVIR